MTSPERALIERLMAVLDSRMTSSGHPYALVTREHLGTCSVWGCSDRCQEYRALFVDGMNWLNEHPEEETQQLALEGIAAR